MPYSDSVNLWMTLTTLGLLGLGALSLAIFAVAGLVIAAKSFYWAITWRGER